MAQPAALQIARKLRQVALLLWGLDMAKPRHKNQVLDANIRSSPTGVCRPQLDAELRNDALPHIHTVRTTNLRMRFHQALVHNDSHPTESMPAQHDGIDGNAGAEQARSPLTGSTPTRREHSGTLAQARAASPVIACPEQETPASRPKAGAVAVREIRLLCPGPEVCPTPSLGGVAGVGIGAGASAESCPRRTHRSARLSGTPGLGAHFARGSSRAWSCRRLGSRRHP